MIAARRERAAFASADCEFLRQLSEHLALAAHQVRLHSALQQAYEDLRQSQQAVMQQERLRALGQMASGIAHDINNALSPASIYTQSLLERDATLSESARETLRVIQRAIDDVGQTVSRMRMFYRPREPELALAPLDLNVLLQQVAELTRARWSDIPQERGIVIDLKKELAPDLPPVMGAENEVRDALTNLVLNAVDAMPEGGTLTLRTGVANGTDGGESALPQVRVEVRDTGVGMTEAVRMRCLEPFFTTKGERGTGLGLAMVYGMVQRHSAELEIESETGSGTTMRVVFPAEWRRDAQRATPAAPASRRLRILLVDDDPLLLKSLTDVLESDGHSVSSADGGQRGIDEFLAARERGESFEAVITDLGMPTVDGRTVAAAVKTSASSTPVILLTGWGQRIQGEGELPEHIDRVLSKPPRLLELRTALEELAGRGSQSH
jgi:signal transduction histidine kinase/ActR/RegA family two-component response regulator